MQMALHFPCWCWFFLSEIRCVSVGCGGTDAQECQVSVIYKKTSTVFMPVIPAPLPWWLTSNASFDSAGRRLKPKRSSLTVQMCRWHGAGVFAHYLAYLQFLGISLGSGAHISEWCWWSLYPQRTGQLQWQQCCPRCTKALHCIFPAEIRDRQGFPEESVFRWMRRDPCLPQQKRTQQACLPHKEGGKCS